MLRNLAVFLPLLGLVNAAVYTVTVGIVEIDGQPGLGFDPSSIRPSAGDTVTFTFALPEYVKNPPSVQHSATQSTFDSPCTPLSGGFDTGIQTTGSANAGTGESFNLQINDTNPLWFYSSVNNDCKSGMVLSINPPLTGDQTAAAFLDKATNGAGISQPPSGPSPTPSSPSSSSSSSSASTSTAASTSGAPSPTKTNGAVGMDGRKGMMLAGVAALFGLSVMA